MTGSTAEQQAEGQPTEHLKTTRFTKTKQCFLSEIQLSPNPLPSTLIQLTREENAPYDRPLRLGHTAARRPAGVSSTSRPPELRTPGSRTSAAVSRVRTAATFAFINTITARGWSAGLAVYLAHTGQQGDEHRYGCTRQAGAPRRPTPRG